MNEEQQTTQVQIGGNLKQSLEQGFKLSIPNVFSEAFQITLKNLGTLMLACLAALGFMMLVTSVLVHGGELLGYIKEVVDEEGNPVIFTKEMIAIGLLMSVFVVPSLIAGFTMMSLNHVVGLKTKPLMIFNFFKLFGPLAVAFALPNLLSMAFMNLGLGILSSLPTIYISAIFSLVIPLMLERQMTVFQAIPTSIRVAHKGFISLFIIHALINLFMLFGFMTVVGLVVIIPFVVTLQAVVYKEVCGIRLTVEVGNDGQKDDNNNGEFSA
ncbi:hypothetical protein [Motilimonas eburnea]|uniref:hypothetical protein n=1 Tax=Motilimonas eburnea TaxID=1737488 RepID=UPI001E3C30FE|nr:hypothetical protein [Motilimonas eburnea]MCE2570395.1 hypothetical protein [Motilimonas eburnea]